MSVHAWRATALVLALAGGGCMGMGPVHVQPGVSGQVATAAPHIASVTPESVSVSRGDVVELVLRGRGFDPGTTPGNTVSIGPMTLGGIAAATDGASLRVVVPDEMRLGTEAPPSAWAPGRYAVSVRNRFGQSDSVYVTIVSPLGGIR